MTGEFRFFPESASSIADQVDSLYIYLLSVACFFSVLIFLLILGFCIYYRRGSQVDRTIGSHGRVWILEMTWSLIPLGLALVMFGWGAELYYKISSPPEDCMTIDVVAKQWMWKLQHPNGHREINTLHLPVNTKVRLRMISDDVIHSFYVPSFRVKQDVLPGRYTSIWFEPTKVGTYHLFCAEYCGTSHSQMRGWVVVESQTDYVDWLRGAAGPTPEANGAALYQQYRCNTCHEGPAPRCPSLVGIAGSQVPLQNGDLALADDNYLRESIVDPTAKIVAGYQPLMPTYRGQIDESNILSIIAYLKSLKPSEPTSGAAAPQNGDESP